MREHSKQELVDKLIRKKFESGEIKRCVDEFCEKDLQSDKRFAESYVRSRYNANKGPIYIISSLKSKGIDDNLINKSLSVYNEEDWQKSAMSALDKKKLPNKIKEVNGRKDKQKMFLRQRGFQYKTIENAIEEFWRE
tara:strand:- start:105 stop:515 length:411 start_codon:yes stop_codon:yes gene_type:complete